MRNSSSLIYLHMDLLPNMESAGGLQEVLLLLLPSRPVTGSQVSPWTGEDVRGVPREWVTTFHDQPPENPTSPSHQSRHPSCLCLETSRFVTADRVRLSARQLPNTVSQSRRPGLPPCSPLPCADPVQGVESPPARTKEHHSEEGSPTLGSGGQPGVSREGQRAGL